jgi:ketosteroid isomerase-like protein
MSKEPVEIVRRIWEAAKRRDTEAVFALYDPAIVWVQSTLPSPTAGTYFGHDGVRELFRQWLETFETFDLKAETFIGAGRDVVVGYRLSGRGKTSGAAVEMRRWNVYTVRNGLVIRVDVFMTEAEALEVAGL